ncbi:hypothetical protein [Algoriphagus aquaeductus]|uniref:hypothetical protein n=1 Tax=Algoriphagus aquaeductus TaxID=475299 RepID=UPI0015EC4F9C|nr:hypothetical protein [Algoriphagus aquaeductus]
MVSYVWVEIEIKGKNKAKYYLVLAYLFYLKNNELLNDFSDPFRIISLIICH